MSFRTVHFLSLEMKIAETVVNESGQRTYDVAAVRSRGRFNYDRG
jgi:hypothetical protein